MGKIANRQSLAILDRGFKSQPFSQFCCIGVFKTNRQSRVSNRNFSSQGRQRFEIRGQKNRTRKKSNSWERRFPGTFRTNVPLILPIFSVFSVGGGPKVPRNFVPGNFFFSYFRWFFSSLAILDLDRAISPI